MLSVKGFRNCASHAGLRAVHNKPINIRRVRAAPCLPLSRFTTRSSSSPSSETEATPPDGRPNIPTPDELRKLGGTQPDWSSGLDSFIYHLIEWPRMVFNSLKTFVVSVWKVLPQFTVPTPVQIVQKTGLMLSASLLLMVVLSSIDSVLLWMYVVKARILA